MIELCYVSSPNVHKICIALEEMALPYRMRVVDLSKGEHHKPENVAGSVTGKLPVICDSDPADGGQPITVCESGAILQYLGEKSGRFFPTDCRARLQVLQWLNWQVSGLGPIGGQAFHFTALAPQIAPDFDNSYALSRYRNMWRDLWKTMDRQLGKFDYLAGDYSIADIACYPWIIYLDPVDGIETYPNIRRWRDAIAPRPAVQRAYECAFSLDTGYERNELGTTLYPMEGILKHVVVT
jgi:GST-like protein